MRTYGKGSRQRARLVWKRNEDQLTTLDTIFAFRKPCLLARCIGFGFLRLFATSDRLRADIFLIWLPLLFNHPKNNIDFIRMVAALFVLYSHQHALMGLPEPSVLGAHSLGGFGVLVFFSISGFLVAQSWHADPSFYRFALKRMLRIWPGMAVAVLLAALVLGPMVSTLPVREYYAHPLIGEYLLNLRFTVRDALPL